MKSPALLVVLALCGCVEDGGLLAGEGLSEVGFHLSGPDMGVYPDTSVLEDEHNPFAGCDIGETTKWEIQSGSSPVVAFFAWATLTARRPTGEHQYYAAANLKAIYTGKLAGPDELAVARELAIRGFQAVLDHFPESLTYDASGTIAYDLATWAYLGIVELGGEVSGGWVLVETADGGKRAIKP